MNPITEKQLKKILITLTVYLTSLFAANTLGLKIMPFLFGSHLTVSIFTLPVIFLTTDVIGEVYGRSTAKLFVRAGFISTALFIAYTSISLWMPWSEDGLWAKEGYNLVFGLSGRMAVASLAAFALAEFQDVWAFFFVRGKIGQRWFWLRSFLSNLWSQLLDAVVFMVIAFAGIYSTKVLVSIIVTLWLYKVAMGLMYTPLSYLAIKLLKEGKPNES